MSGYELYDIDARIWALIDPETGEILDSAVFESLAMERGEKLENVALDVKNHRAMIEALRAEEKSLSDRRAALERRAKAETAFLRERLNGEKLETPRAKCTWRRSTAVTLDSSFIPCALESGGAYLRFRDPEPDKKAIADALKAGTVIPGAALEERMNLTII